MLIVGLLLTTATVAEDEPHDDEKQNDIVDIAEPEQPKAEHPIDAILAVIDRAYERASDILVGGIDQLRSIIGESDRNPPADEGEPKPAEINPVRNLTKNARNFVIVGFETAARVFNETVRAASNIGSIVQNGTDHIVGNVGDSAGLVAQSSFNLTQGAINQTSRALEVASRNAVAAVNDTLIGVANNTVAIFNSTAYLVERGINITAEGVQGFAGQVKSLSGAAANITSAVGAGAVQGFSVIVNNTLNALPH